MVGEDDLGAEACQNFSTDLLIYDRVGITSSILAHMQVGFIHISQDCWTNVSTQESKHTNRQILIPVS